MTLKIDRSGYKEILNSRMRDEVNAAAEKIAAAVRGLGIRVGDRDGGASEYDLPVTVTSYTTDRAVAVVAIAHPAGQAVQAKHGALTKGASSAGLKVVSK